MRHKYLWVALAAVVVSGCARRVEVESGGEVMATVPATGSVLPAGTSLQTRLNQTLSTDNSKVNDMFTLTVTNNVIAQNGDIVVPAGATIHGRVTAVDDSDNPTDKAVIALELNRLEFSGRSYNFGANVQSVAAINERNPKTGEVLRRAGTGAAIGAAIGAIVSGAELDAILKGGAIGAAVGTVISLGVGDVEHEIPAGTMMTIQATQTVALR